MNIQDTYKLNNGVRIPVFGLGTWQSKSQEVYQAVLTALKAGYKHIDTASVYRNEKEVGQAIKDSGIPRQEIFVTTKIWNTCHRPELVETALNESLANLQLDYVDLYLMHWPVAFEPSKFAFPKNDKKKIAIDKSISIVDTYTAMEKLVQTGKVELHPYLSQPDLLSFCQSHDIHVTAYSPLGSTNSPLINDARVLEISKKYQTLPANILISWGIQRGCSVIPKSITPSRIISNFRIFQLDTQDFEVLENLTGEQQRLLDPSSTWGISVYHSKL